MEEQDIAEDEAPLVCAEPAECQLGNRNMDTEFSTQRLSLILQYSHAKQSQLLDHGICIINEAFFLLET